MIILAIDPSTTSLGWAVEGECGTLTAAGDRPTRFRILHRKLSDLMLRVHPDVVVYYRPFARGDDATRCGWGIAGIVELAANTAQVAVMDVAEGTVRAFHVFPRGIDRAALKRFALDKCRDLGHRVETDDEADAVLLLTYAQEKIR